MRAPRIQGIALWAPIAGLLALGLLTSIFDLAALPGKEARRANTQEQRFTVNAGSGEVSLGVPHEKAPVEEAAAEPAPAMGTDEESAAKEHAPEAAEAPTEGTAEAKSETHPKPEGAVEAPAAESPTAKEGEAAPAEHGAEAAATEHPSAEHPAAEAAASPTAEHADAPAATAEAAPVANAENAAAATAPAAAPAAKPTPADAALPANTPSLRTAPMAAPPIDKITRTNESLVSAPAPEVSEMLDGVRVSKIGERGIKPSKLYAHPFKRKDEQVVVSFVVINTGLDPQSVGLILNLPPEVSVAYSAYTRPEMSYSENLRAAGHEVWTMLPVMSDRYPNDDPGPLGLIARMPPEEMSRRFTQTMAVIPGSIGFVLPPDEAITTQSNSLAPVLEEIRTRGLLLFISQPTHSVDQITKEKPVAELIRRADLVLDPAPNDAQIRSKLAGILASAKEKGEYNVVLSARPQSLKILAEWLHASPLEEPYVLGPLSAMYQAKASPAEAPAEGEAKPEKKEKPKAKPKPKVLPQDQYKQPPAGEKGGHGGGEKKEEGHH